MDINSKEYWDKRFLTDWDANMGRSQTEFFVKIAIDNFPQWFLDDVKNNKLSICDFGCADGDGVKLLSDFFTQSRIAGVDFSQEAINIAKKSYEKNEFIVGSPDDFSEVFDVFFSSNTFEHFEKPFEVLTKILKNAGKYIVLLLPFNEFERISEHFYTFEFKSFPLKIKNFSLSFSKVIDSGKIENTHWAGNQILLIYSNSNAINLEDIRLDSILGSNVDEIRSSLDKKVIEQREQLNSFEKEKEEQRQAYESEKNATEKELLELSSSYQSTKQKIEKLEQVLANKELSISEYKNEINTIYSSKAWKLISSIKKKEEKYILISYMRKFVYYSMFMGVGQTLKKSAKKVFSLIHGKVFRMFSSLFKQVPKVSKDYKELPNHNKDKKVYIFAGVPYYDIGGGQRSSQLAKVYHKMGFNVTYLYAFESNESEKKDIYLPFEEHFYVKNYAVEIVKKIKKDILMVFEIPHKDFLPFLDMAKVVGAKTVYEHIDNWETNLGTAFFEVSIFDRFLLESDLLVATARLLKEKIEEHIDNNKDLSGCKEKVHYLPNAVDTDLFDPLFDKTRPLDLITGEKTLLYYGSLWGNWFEWELVRYVAANYPQCSINIIGDYKPVEDKIWDMEKNIHFLGLKKQMELPAYLRYSDIAILPFKCDEIGLYVSPLKIFEYIAMNKPAISTELPDIVGYPNVYRSNSKEKWLEIAKSNIILEPIDNFLAKNNWYYTCNYIMDDLFPKIEKEDTFSIVILNRNNRNVIERCVESLLYYNQKYNAEVIVVDNDSSDGSYELLLEKYSDKIKIVKNSKNGCSSGRNLGVRNSTGSMIVFLDSDQWVVSSRWMDTALYILSKNQKVGCVGWAAGWFDKMTIVGQIVDYLPNRGIDGVTLYRTDIGYLGSGGMFLRRKLFESIKGFDEYYDPTCFEDTDISLAVRNAGYEIAYCPFINLKHLPHQTTNSGSQAHTKLMNRNSEYFKAKWGKINPKLLDYYY